MWHYYPRFKGAPKGYQITATFRDANGKAVKDENSKPRTVRQELTFRTFRQSTFDQRTRTELARLAISLFAVIAALAAGAREQLLKLDVLQGLIAAFLAGFGADTVKNLLTQAPSIKR